MEKEVSFLFRGSFFFFSGLIHEIRDTIVKMGLMVLDRDDGMRDDEE